MRRIPKVRQHDDSDCGVACLSSIARFYGQRIPLARLRQYALTDKQGSSLLGLSTAAQKLGFSTTAVRATPEALARAPMPAIAHLTFPNGRHHFVVLERTTGRHVWLMDPALGERCKARRSEFEAQWSRILLLVAPAPGRATSAEPTRRAQRVWHLIRPHRAALVQSLVGALVVTLLGLAMSVYVQKIVDSVLADGQAGPLTVMSLAMVAITLAQTIIAGLRSALMLQVSQHVDAALILGYYRHLLALPLAFFDRMRTGELTSRVNDAVKIRSFVGDMIVEAAANVLVIATSAALMFAYDWQLAVWTLGLFPLYTGLYVVGSRINRRQQRILMEHAAALEAQIVESLAAAGTIKRFGLEQHATLTTESRFVRLFRGIARSTLTSIWLNACGSLVGRIGTIGLLWLGTTHALAQELSAGQLMSCYALLGLLTGPALSLVGFSRALEEARIAGERLFEIMELEPETQATRVTLAREQVGDVQFEQVTFRYGGRAPALSSVSFACRRGAVTAIVGESGSGKSTIASLIQRLYPVDHGRITIGHHDIAHLDPSSLRRVVAVVPQTIDLFAGTVLENLVLDDPSPDIPRLMGLCTEIGIREAIERMPRGWMTIVGERGATLSGGERQRLALVRALYREPSILIMDEATSALDSASEQRVVDAIHAAACRGMTIVMIAHRLTTIAGADHIIVLANGRLVEEGDHQLLAEVGGAYSRLWERQRPLVPRLVASGWSRKGP